MLMQWVAGRLTKVGLKINIHNLPERLGADIGNARRKVESSDYPTVSIVLWRCLQMRIYLMSKHAERTEVGLLIHAAQRFGHHLET